MLIPLLKEVGGPSEALVHVTEVAGIWTAGLEFSVYGWTVDFVTSDRFEDAVGGMWHVAIVALAARGTGFVVGVSREIGRDLGVALSAGLSARAVASELIVWTARVERVARKATNLSLGMALGFDETVVFAP